MSPLILAQAVTALQDCTRPSEECIGIAVEPLRPMLDLLDTLVKPPAIEPPGPQGFKTEEPREGRMVGAGQEALAMQVWPEMPHGQNHSQQLPPGSRSNYAPPDLECG